jgi:hypothetical protein
MGKQKIYDNNNNNNNIHNYKKSLTSLSLNRKGANKFNIIKYPKMENF